MEAIIQRFSPLWGEWYPDAFLGQGSFGTVWHAKNQRGEEAAIKEVIIPFHRDNLYSARAEGLTVEGAKEYFRALMEETKKEIDLMRSLQDCSTVVRFRDSQVMELNGDGEFGWAIYILMDLLTPLSTRITKERFSVRDTAALAVDIAQALEACEEAGIVHRDIKPDNLFYDAASGRYQLGDFGIAHYLARPTEGKGKAGTLTHMPPEVFQGAEFTPQADLYALGMILFRMLNDNRIPLLPPFPAPFGPAQRDRATVQRLMGAPVGKPSILTYAAEEREMDNQGFGVYFEKSDIPLAIALGEIAARTIDADPEKRFCCAAEFRKAVEETLYQI